MGMTRDELEVCRRVQRRVEREESKLADLRATLAEVTSRLDGLPHGWNYGSRIEGLVAKIIDLERQIEALKAIWTECIVELNERLGEVIQNAARRTVLLRRYGFCRSFDVIIRETGYSRRHVFYLHRKGLRELGL